MTKDFRPYMHLEKFGATEVLNIELGNAYVFPKIDGTNGSIWYCDQNGVQAGSRKRHLSIQDDNAGFCDYVLNNERYNAFFDEFPHLRLYGEWLVPHSLKTYREDAWKRFYVFDVAVDDEEGVKYVHYEIYKHMLEKHGIDYIAPLAKINNGTYEQFVDQLAKNVFLVKDGEGAGEGIVIKNYDFCNRFGRQTWAKIVTSEFKEKHHKEMGPPELNGKKMVEEEIAEGFVTQALVEKVYAKIENEDGWSNKKIPQLLNTVFYDVVREECWEFVKQFKNPTINFSALKHMVFTRVKKLKPELF